MLEEHAGTHKKRQQVKRVVPQAPHINRKERVRLREVLDPEEMGPPHLHRAREGVVQGDKNGDLNEHREAPAQWIDSMFAIQPHYLLLLLFWIIFIPLRKEGDLRLQGLHRLHRLEAFCGEGMEGDLLEYGDQDNSYAVVAAEAIQKTQQVKRRAG